MALLFFDGFDHYFGLDPATVTKWSSASSVLVSAAFVRTGTHALRLGSGSGAAGSVTSPFVAASGGVVVGVGYRFDAYVSGNNLLEVYEGATLHLAVAIVDPGPVLAIKRGTTTLATATGPTLVANTWVYIELLGVIHDSAGSYEVRVDGVTVLTASGIDTRNTGATGQWDRVKVLGVTNGFTYSYLDDVYLCDTSSAIRNTFLGGCKVETLYPQTDAVAAGSNAGLTPSTGTDHGALVDENPPNTSDYNSSATVGLKDTYQYPSLSLTGTVLGIQTNLYVQKSDAAVRQVCAVVRAGGTDYDGANVSPGTSFTYRSEVRAQNPNTSADWTSSDITSLQAGMKVTV